LALLLDTRSLHTEDRDEILHETFAHADVPRRVCLTGLGKVSHTRLDAWMFGSVMLFSPDSPGLKVTRTPTLEAMEPIIALIVQIRGLAQFTQEGQRQDLLPGVPIMAGPISPNEFQLSGHTSAFQLPFDEIGIPLEIAGRASERLTSSPLFSLVSHHLMWIRENADSLSSASADNVGAATTHLVRALIVSAAEDDRDARSALADALLPRILAYVRQHLTDRDLTPAAIAKAHSISLRYLYKVCSIADVRLVEWIIEERLNGAREDLIKANQSLQPIASIASKWGFKSPSHFSSRFRRAYGVSPRDLIRHSRRQYRDQL
jgi:AraC-like DNA-binding protein